MIRSSSRRLAAALIVTAASVAVLPGAAQAATTPPAPEVSISDCQVKQERNKTFSYAWCTVDTSAPAGTNISVRYRSSMATFKPPTGGTWSPQTRTIAFTGGGEQILTLKFAFKGKTPAQVRKNLKVTLSNATGATIGTATATVAN